MSFQEIGEYSKTPPLITSQSTFELQNDSKDLDFSNVTEEFYAEESGIWVSQFTSVWLFFFPLRVTVHLFLRNHNFDLHI